MGTPWTACSPWEGHLAAQTCPRSTSRTSEPQLAGAMGRPCPPYLPGPCSGSCLMGSPPASSQVRSPERCCIMATWPRAHGPQPSCGINPRFLPLSMPSSALPMSHECQPRCSPFSSLNSPGWGQAQGLSTHHSFSLQGRPHTLQGGLPSSMSTQTPPLRSPLAEVLLCPAPPTPGPSLFSRQLLVWETWSASLWEAAEEGEKARCGASPRTVGRRMQRGLVRRDLLRVAAVHTRPPCGG